MHDDSCGTPRDLSRAIRIGVVLCGIALPLAAVETVLSAHRALKFDAQLTSGVGASHCGTTNPFYATTRIPHPVLLVTEPDLSAIVAFQDRPTRDPQLNYEEQLDLASARDVGAVYGLAYDWRRRDLYAAAFHNARLDFGSGGPGAIYRVELDGGGGEVWASIDAGPNRFVYGSWGSSEVLLMLTAIGRTGLGDIEIAEDGTELLVANLYDRRIHRLAIPSGEHLGDFAHGGVGEPWAANARLFGLGVRSGWLYHGVVDSREDASQPGELRARVYRSRIDGSEMHEVLSMDLRYSRILPWSPWTDDLASQPWNTSSQPLLVDIEFRPTGELILAFNDRLQEMVMPGPMIHGDIILTESAGEALWRPIDALDFYEDDFFVAESMSGGLASVPRTDAALTGMVHLLGWGAIFWLRNDTGRVGGPVDGRENVFAGESTSGGDIESLCGPATVYLPVVASSDCIDRAPVDVVLVIDASTSMLRDTALGRTKLAAAVEAASQFVSLLRDEDRSAVVAFNESAWVARSMTYDGSAVRSTLAHLDQKVVEGTRLDLALKAAADVLSHSESTPERHRAVILMTDGLPNRVPPAEDGRPETTVLQAADEVKRQDAMLYTIGLGMPSDVDEVLLRAAASSSSRYHYAPDGEDLVSIFAALGSVVGCR